MLNPTPQEVWMQLKLHGAHCFLCDSPVIEVVGFFVPNDELRAHMKCKEGLGHGMGYGLCGLCNEDPKSSEKVAEIFAQEIKAGAIDNSYGVKYLESGKNKKAKTPVDFHPTEV